MVGSWSFQGVGSLESWISSRDLPLKSSRFCEFVVSFCLMSFDYIVWSLKLQRSLTRWSFWKTRIWVSICNLAIHDSRGLFFEWSLTYGAHTFDAGWHRLGSRPEIPDHSTTGLSCRVLTKQIKIADTHAHSSCQDGVGFLISLIFEFLETEVSRIVLLLSSSSSTSSCAMVGLRCCSFSNIERQQRLRRERTSTLQAMAMHEKVSPARWCVTFQDLQFLESEAWHISFWQRGFDA